MLKEEEEEKAELQTNTPLSKCWPPPRPPLPWAALQGHLLLQVSQLNSHFAQEARGQLYPHPRKPPLPKWDTPFTSTWLPVCFLQRISHTHGCFTAITEGFGCALFSRFMRQEANGLFTTDPLAPSAWPRICAG